MDTKEAMEVINKTFMVIFGQTSPYTLEEVLSEFAFDVRLPQRVIDSVTGEETWASAVSSAKYITQENMRKFDEKRGWMIPKRNVKNLKEILDIWKITNYTTTQRLYDCINVSQSDPMYTSENVFRSTDCRKCKNIIFSDGCNDCENIIACQRSATSSFGLRIADSANCTNSYNIICSSKISNSYFIQDCNNLYECIFCPHIANKRYCIANMQFEKEEYAVIKKAIIKWILTKKS